MTKLLAFDCVLDLSVIEAAVVNGEEEHFARDLHVVMAVVVEVLIGAAFVVVEEVEETLKAVPASIHQTSS